MGQLISENTSRVINTVINVLTVFTVALVAYQSVVVNSINKDIENIKHDAIRDLSFLKETMMTESRVIQIIQDKSPYKVDLPKLAQERAEIMTMIANLQWKDESVTVSIQSLLASLNDLKADINSTHAKFNAIQIELERIRFQLNVLTDKKKESGHDETPSGG